MRFQQGVEDRPDPAADLGDRQRGVLLQQREDLAIDGVHFGINFSIFRNWTFII